MKHYFETAASTCAATATTGGARAVGDGAATAVAARLQTQQIEHEQHSMYR